MNSFPRHIAIIMDGNGRWAAERGLGRSAGHKAGAEAARRVVTECRERGLEYLTLYVFSSENWQRPAKEVADLFLLLLDFIKEETPRMVREGIRLSVLGDLDGLPMAQRAALRHAMRRTAQNSAMTLNLALNYGGRAELVRAARRLLESAQGSASITEEQFAAQLYTAGQPDPDLLIRTSGEQRISNFLLFQCAYTELYFTPTLWPDFSALDLDKALEAYSARSRRYGRVE